MVSVTARKIRNQTTERSGVALGRVYTGYLISYPVIGRGMVIFRDPHGHRMITTPVRRVLGEPTGLTARFRSGANNFQSHVAWSFSGDSFTLTGDYLRSGDIDTDPVIPFYFGLGARLRFDDGDTRFGVRIPLGLNYVLNSEPIEFFGELVPMMDVVPDTKFDFGGAIGIRYYSRPARD